MPAIPLRGAAVRTHSAKVPGAAGGARWPGWGSQVGGTAAAPPHHHQATQVCPLGTRRMPGTWEANLGFLGREGGPSPL